MNKNTFLPEDIPEARRKEIFENIYKTITEEKQEENIEQNEQTDDEIIEIFSPGFVY